ncbi:MAG: hypothetical protein GY861_23215 [bacterium]|nr:hypothetical protein [bacterium]
MIYGNGNNKRFRVISLGVNEFTEIRQFYECHFDYVDILQLGKCQVTIYMARTGSENIKDFLASFQICFNMATTIEIAFIARSDNAAEGTGMTFVNNFLKPAF